jgi:uncharacterized membrane protein
MIEALSGIGAAFGLSGSAGLNAYIPLLIVALAARFPLNTPLLQLQSPYDVLGSWWAIGIISVLLIIEVVADKIPAVDSVNDAIQTFIRPAAGAILFAGSANVITDIHPVLSLAAGLLVAGGVHATKAVARPVVTATTVGTGNWLVSIVEDVIAFILSLLSLIVPILAGLIFALLFFAIIFYFRGRRRRRLVHELNAK